MKEKIKEAEEQEKIAALMAELGLSPINSPVISKRRATDGSQDSE